MLGLIYVSYLILRRFSTGGQTPVLAAALAVFGFAVDVQAGGLGVWTFIGGGSLVAGSLTLYGGDARLNPPWWVLAIVIVGTALFMLGAMTAVVRFVVAATV